ncbi:MAG: hypothetical protein KGJ14_09810, partial [Nitrospirota bacterium]|nr:hypothetical protein [Nitrospirota bacterium]
GCGASSRMVVCNSVRHLVPRLDERPAGLDATVAFGDSAGAPPVPARQGTTGSVGGATRRTGQAVARSFASKDRRRGNDPIVGRSMAFLVGHSLPGVEPIR